MPYCINSPVFQTNKRVSELLQTVFSTDSAKYNMARKEGKWEGLIAEGLSYVRGRATKHIWLRSFFDKYISRLELRSGMKYTSPLTISDDIPIKYEQSCHILAVMPWDDDHEANVLSVNLKSSPGEPFNMFGNDVTKLGDLGVMPTCLKLIKEMENSAGIPSFIRKYPSLGVVHAWPKTDLYLIDKYKQGIRTYYRYPFVISYPARFLAKVVAKSLPSVMDDPASPHALRFNWASLGMEKLILSCSNQKVNNASAKILVYGDDTLLCFKSESGYNICLPDVKTMDNSVSSKWMGGLAKFYSRIFGLYDKQKNPLSGLEMKIDPFKKEAFQFMLMFSFQKYVNVMGTSILKLVEGNASGNPLVTIINQPIMLTLIFNCLKQAYAERVIHKPYTEGVVDADIENLVQFMCNYFLSLGFQIKEETTKLGYCSFDEAHKEILDGKYTPLIEGLVQRWPEQMDDANDPVRFIAVYKAFKRAGRFLG